MSTSEKEQARAGRRLGTMRARFQAAVTPRERLAVAYDWLRAAQPSGRTADALARQIAGLAERLDSRAAGYPQPLSRVTLSDGARDRPAS